MMTQRRKEPDPGRKRRPAVSGGAAATDPITAPERTVPARHRIHLWQMAILLLLLPLLTGCGTEVAAKRARFAVPDPESAPADWAIYWYLCGSDLESWDGCATADLKEMLSVSLPEGVEIVLETGGASEWKNSQISPDVLERYVYNRDGLFLLDQLPKSSMGSPDTLTDFLRFCRDCYPADHTMVLIWDHGGGVSGAAFDQNFDYDALTLDEMYDAFGQVYDLSASNPPLDVIAFDACLMASIDTAYTFCDIARCLIASEETEPADGWYYAPWLRALGNHPDMDGAALGKAICDAYAQGCTLAGTAEEMTLSVIDLGKLEPLMKAYNALGEDALIHAVESPGFLPALGREASRAENYGGNTPEQGYANLVDLGDLARNCETLLPGSAEAVIEALEACVICQVNGPYRSGASGLSCYYSYNASRKDFSGYVNIGASEAFKYLYRYKLDGSLDSMGLQYLGNIGYTGKGAPDVPGLTGEEAFPLYPDGEGNAVLDVGPEMAGRLSQVSFLLAVMDEDADTALFLGQDNAVRQDWDRGIFTENFRGTWGAIDGHLVYTEIVYDGPDYHTCSIPVLLNGEAYNLRVVCDHRDGSCSIIGARRALDENGMADRNLRLLQPGDTITTIHYAATLSGDDAFAPFEGDTFLLTEETSFGPCDLADGEYVMIFELTDARNQTAWSDMASFTMRDGVIYTSIEEDSPEEADEAEET